MLGARWPAKRSLSVIILSLLLVFCLLGYLYGLTCILFVSYTPSNQQKAHDGRCSHLEDTPTHNSGFCLHPSMDCHQDLLTESPVVFLCLRSCPAHKTTANTLFLQIVPIILHPLEHEQRTSILCTTLSHTQKQKNQATRNQNLQGHESKYAVSLQAYLMVSRSYLLQSQQAGQHRSLSFTSPAILYSFPYYYF